MSATQTDRTYGGPDVMGIRSVKVTFKYDLVNEMSGFFLNEMNFF